MIQVDLPTQDMAQALPGGVPSKKRLVLSENPVAFPHPHARRAG